MEKQEICIYKEILKGERKRFPRGFWDTDSETKSANIIRYLFLDVLDWDLEFSMEHISVKLFSEYKVSTIFNKQFKRSFSSILKVIYIGEVDFNMLPCREATKQALSKTHKNLPQYKKDKIVKGMRENRYSKDYAKKLSDTKLGELNPCHKLKSEEVLSIRDLWKSGTHTTTTIGDKFGVKRQTIADIVYGRTWKHVV